VGAKIPKAIILYNESKHNILKGLGRQDQQKGLLMVKRVFFWGGEESGPMLPHYEAKWAHAAHFIFMCIFASIFWLHMEDQI